jgi:type II secretory pathway pseudopilin PulG
MRASKPLRITHGAARRERGATTLFVTLIILIILTLIVLASTNVALFEQKTATNENRQHLAEQAAEYYLSLGGEYLKANAVNIASDEDDDGWLKSGGTNLHWQKCPSSGFDSGHPCAAERDPTRLTELYYYVRDGKADLDGSATNTNLDLPVENLPAGALLTKVGPRDGGGTAAFDVSTHVRALLCRLDTTTGSTPSCQAVPTSGNRIAFTLISTSTMAGENAAAEVKETWGSISSFTATSAVPLVAAGVVKGLGNASIVASANAGGYGLAASVWSPNDVDVDGSGANICGVKSGGVGSVTTCHLGDYLGTVPVSELQTTCAGSGKTGCGCSNVAKGSPDMLSGHFGGTTTQETYDILDVDSAHGSPDITFFPGTQCSASGGARMDHRADGGTKACLASEPSCFTDDNLFEWIFGVDVTGVDGSGLDVVGYPVTSDINKAEISALSDLGAETLTDCSTLDSDSEGLYYVSGTCQLKADVGSPDHQVVLVADGDVQVSGNFNLYGMLFARDPGTGASFKGAGTVNVFGSVIVEGDVDVSGSLNIIYVESTGGKPGSKLKANTTFARLTGSWLDASQGF